MENRQIIEKILTEQKTPGYIWLVEIIGRRISYLCGRNPDYPLIQEIHEISLGSRYKLLAQKENCEYTDEEILSLKTTGEIIESYLP